MRRAVAIAGALCALGGGARRDLAARQQVRLTVVDEESRSPILDAQVVALSEDGVPRAQGFTGPGGELRLGLPRPGRYRLRVARVGYAAFQSKLVEVGEGQQVFGRIHLDAEPIALDELEVLAMRPAEVAHLAEFNERRLDPARTGYFLTREDIERRPSATASQLLLQAPGVRLTRLGGGMDRSLVRFGNCTANLYVDGVGVQQDAQHSIDDLLNETQIAGIEVYPRRAMAPPRYRTGIDDPCGVVLFWMQRPEAVRGGGGNGKVGKIVGTVLGLGLFIFAFSTIFTG